MMIGPMKKKVITSSVVTAIILILIFVAIAFAFMSQNNKKIAELERKGEVVERYVFTKDLLAGDVVTADDIELVEVKGESAPVDSYEDTFINGANVIVRSDRKLDVALKPLTYNEDLGIVGRRLKVNSLAKTIVTASLFYDVDDDPDMDTRLQEFNMISLPSDLVEGDYVDVRIRFATGEDYSVIVGKKVEAIGALQEQSNTIFLRLSEEEIVRMASAIIESYINDGILLYANKYVDPANQLYDYEYTNLVNEYKNLKTITSKTIVSGEEVVDESASRERTVSELASLMHISTADVKNIIEAVEKNDKNTLDYYSNKLVKTEKSIKTTYPVKVEVATLIKNNPNILEVVKAKYNVESLMIERQGFMNTDLTKVDEFTGEITPHEEHIANIKERLDNEIEVQRTERQEYLLNLLNSQNASTTNEQ